MPISINNPTDSFLNVPVFCSTLKIQEELVKSKNILTGLILSSDENTEFLKNFYNNEREREWDKWKEK